jgi:hypothetical protein
VLKRWLRLFGAVPSDSPFAHCNGPAFTIYLPLTKQKRDSLGGVLDFGRWRAMSCQSRCHSESERFWALPGLQGPAEESGEVSQEHRHAVRAAGEEPARQFVQDLTEQALLEFYAEEPASRSMGNHLFVRNAHLYGDEHR